MEGFVALVADRQPPVARQPGECPLDHPAMPPQPLLTGGFITLARGVRARRHEST